ncbi:phage head morphogenesis protein [Psychrobacter phage pOW20-A]|uniref:head morphogenesis n=1 Tax=Psychrobacter phage pOW20-A TaxID=754048 RepID=UPI0002C188D7|nr:head morphogenesis [Psychrobacter phage pOW20-A]AGH57504.1 phage head morphogenesis protein [Psychrobacter phage pOW20-A]
MTLQTIAPLLKQGRETKRGRKAQAKPVVFSRAAEIAYTKELLKVSELCKTEGLEIAKYMQTTGLFVGDAAIGDAPAWLNRLTQKFSDVASKVGKVSQGIAEKVTNKQAKATDKQLVDQIKSMSGIDITGVMKAGTLTEAVNTAITANVQLIESIPSQYQQRLETIILTGLQDGKSSAFIEGEIKALGQSTDARARLIARDQMGKLNGRFNELRQQSLGITHYYWSTSNDERVRRRHKGYDGDLIAWNSPPPDGHPGQAIRCRCTPIPALDDLLG